MPSLDDSLSGTGETDEIDEETLRAFESEAREEMFEWPALEFAGYISEASTNDERTIYLACLRDKPKPFQEEVRRYLTDAFFTH